MTDQCTGPLPKAWYRDKARLVAEYERHGSMSAVAVAHNMADAARLSKAWKTFGLPPLKPGPQPRAVQRESGTPNELDAAVLAAIKKLGDEGSLTDIANMVDASPARVQEAFDRLGHDGYRLEASGEAVVMHRQPVPSETEHKVLFDGELYRFGIASDAHLNSKHCRLAELHIAYDRFAFEGIETVYNPGDITAGRGIYRGQDHEILNHTYTDQVDYVDENYPYREGIVTRIISGNHDCEGDFGRAGADACLAVANRRDDIVWDGRYSASYYLPQGTRIDMRHPMGGSSYAKSYVPQKFAESFEGGDKPNVILFGHWHNALFLSVRNIQMINCGTFEGGGNTLSMRKPLGAPAVGFWIVDMTVADDGSVVQFQPTWFPFYKDRRAA